MLLKCFYDFAYSRKILEDTAFVKKPIRWIIPVTSEGTLISGGPIETQGEGKKGKLFEAPKTFLDKGIGGIAEFLADGITALFGLEQNPDAKLAEVKRMKREVNNRKKFLHFWSQIQEAFEKTGSPFLGPILAFHELYGSAPPFLRYGKGLDSKKAKQSEKWWVRSANGTETSLGLDQFTFQVSGTVVIGDDEVIRPYWQALYQAQVADKEIKSDRGICLVTSQEDVPIAKTHLPLIKGVPGAKNQDRKIVSFDKDAFVSYGFDQSANAPVSVQAVVAYVNAINWMTAREDHSLVTDNGIILFWAKKSPRFSGVFSSLLKLADPSAVARFLSSPWTGLEGKLIRQDDFVSVAMTGNGSRVAIRDWVDMPVTKAVDNLADWFRDLEIVHLMPRRTQKERKDDRIIPPLAITELAKTTVRDQKDMEPMLLVHIYRAAIAKTRVPLKAVHSILQRLKTDIAKYGPGILCSPLSPEVQTAVKKDHRNLPAGASRFALLRLILNRNRKESEPMIEPKVFETDDDAYNCGRLLAVLADAQAKAHNYELEGPGVAQRYFGAASVSPSSVFPLLLRLNRHHLDKIRKSEKYSKHAGYIEDDIQKILSYFKPEGTGNAPCFPRYLELQAQGRFAIGFYQQKADADARRTYQTEDSSGHQQYGKGKES